MPFTFPVDSTSKAGAVRATADGNNYYLPSILYNPADGTTGLFDTAAHSGFVKLSDGTNTATLGIFHNADGQSISGTSYGILTGGVEQLFNGTTMDRKRSVQGIGDASTGVGLESSGNYLFNGTTWDRMRTAVAVGDANAGTGVEVSSLVSFNGTTYDRLRSGGNAADAVATGTLGSLQTVGFNYGFNGTTWDRLQVDASKNLKVTVNAALPTGANTIGAVKLQDNGGNGLLVSSNAADAITGSGTLSTGNYLFNGTSFDRQYNNTQGTLLASAARTANPVIANQNNLNAKGVNIFLNVTAASGTGGLTLRVNIVDPISGATFGLNAAPTAVTATGIYVYTVYPGVGAGGTQVTSAILPRTWTVSVTHGDATSYTYSVGYSLIL